MNMSRMMSADSFNDEVLWSKVVDEEKMDQLLVEISRGQRGALGEFMKDVQQWLMSVQFSAAIEVFDGNEIDEEVLNLLGSDTLLGLLKLVRAGDISSWDAFSRQFQHDFLISCEQLKQNDLIPPSSIQSLDEIVEAPSVQHNSIQEEPSEIQAMNELDEVAISEITSSLGYVEETACDNELQQRVESAFTRLSDRRRQVLGLLLDMNNGEERTTQEVANSLGVTECTIEQSINASFRLLYKPLFGFAESGVRAADKRERRIDISKQRLINEEIFLKLEPEFMRQKEIIFNALFAGFSPRSRELIRNDGNGSTTFSILRHSSDIYVEGGMKDLWDLQQTRVDNLMCALNRLKINNLIAQFSHGSRSFDADSFYRATIALKSLVQEFKEMGGVENEYADFD